MAQPQLKITLENSNAITCDECGNDTFVEVHYVRRISKLLVGSPEDIITTVPTFACLKCSHVNDQFKIVDTKDQKPNQKSSIIQP